MEGVMATEKPVQQIPLDGLAYSIPGKTLLFSITRYIYVKASVLNTAKERKEAISCQKMQFRRTELHCALEGSESRAGLTQEQKSI